MVRGCRKWVPLNVDRKLYSATLLVMLPTSTDAVHFACFSEWKRLSDPMPTLKTCRGLTRSGLWSSSSWPACGSVSNFDVRGPLQAVMGLSNDAKTPLQARPIVVCCAAVRANAASESGTPLTTSPLSYRQDSASHSAFFC